MKATIIDNNENICLQAEDTTVALDYSREFIVDVLFHTCRVHKLELVNAKIALFEDLLSPGVGYSGLYSFTNYPKANLKLFREGLDLLNSNWSKANYLLFKSFYCDSEEFVPVDGLLTLHAFIGSLKLRPEIKLSQDVYLRPFMFNFYLHNQHKSKAS